MYKHSKHSFSIRSHLSMKLSNPVSLDYNNSNDSPASYSSDETGKTSINEWNCHNSICDDDNSWLNKQHDK